jgi:small subunit ribosomal protein S17e
MGRIKSTMVKRAAEQIMHQNSGFTPSFEENKVKLRNILPSKSVKNKVAGYIARLVKMEQNKEKREQKKAKPAEEPEQYLMYASQ